LSSSGSTRPRRATPDARWPSATPPDSSIRSFLHEFPAHRRAADGAVPTVEIRPDGQYEADVANVPRRAAAAPDRPRRLAAAGRTNQRPETLSPDHLGEPCLSPRRSTKKRSVSSSRSWPVATKHMYHDMSAAGKSRHSLVFRRQW
jgi:hypothetical protein